MENDSEKPETEPEVCAVAYASCSPVPGSVWVPASETHGAYVRMEVSPSCDLLEALDDANPLEGEKVLNITPVGEFPEAGSEFFKKLFPSDRGREVLLTFHRLVRDNLNGVLDSENALAIRQAFLLAGQDPLLFQSRFDYHYLEAYLAQNNPR